MTDTGRAKRILEFELGNYLAAMEDAEVDDEERLSMLAGQVEGLRMALNIVESAEDGKDVTDLGVGSTTVEEMRTRAQNHRKDE